MRFNKKDRELARQSAEHHRENLTLAKSRKWRSKYSLGVQPCAICCAYADCDGCPLGRVGQTCHDCNSSNVTSLYELIVNLMCGNAWPKLTTKKGQLVRAFTDMVRVLDLIASGSCTVAQAKPTERT